MAGVLSQNFIPDVTDRFPHDEAQFRMVGKNSNAGQQKNYCTITGLQKTIEQHKGRINIYLSIINQIAIKSSYGFIKKLM